MNLQENSVRTIVPQGWILLLIALKIKMQAKHSMTNRRKIERKFLNEQMRNQELQILGFQIS